MYIQYYGLSGEPFRLTPDARFFYASRTHRKAMAYLTYGLAKAEGFVVMTGEIGAGKTTLLQHLRETLDDPAIVTGWIVTSQVEADDLLRLVAAGFRLTEDEIDKGSLIRRIEAFLVDCRERQKRACLIVDEAQSLPASSLEELRMLSNLHGVGSALLQIFLVGQPDFRAVLQSPHLEQLRQRVIVSCHLPALEDDETREYVEHRLRCVNWRGDPVFSEPALARVHALTGGLPRKINLLCDRLLLYGFLEGKHHLDAADVGAVVADYEDEISGLAASPVAGGDLPAHVARPAPPPARPSPERTAGDTARPPSTPRRPAVTTPPSTEPDPGPVSTPAAGGSSAVAALEQQPPSDDAAAPSPAPDAASPSPASARPSSAASAAMRTAGERVADLAARWTDSAAAGLRMVKTGGVPAWLLVLAAGGIAAVAVVILLAYLFGSPPRPPVSALPSPTVAAGDALTCGWSGQSDAIRTARGRRQWTETSITPRATSPLPLTVTMTAYSPGAV